MTQEARMSCVVQVASKVVAHKDTLQSILESLDTQAPEFQDRMLALNSIIGSAEMYKDIVKQVAEEA